MASPHRNSPVSFAPCTHCSDSSTGPQFLFTDVAHSKDLVTALRFLRQDEDLCDIVLRVGSTSISAHKVVLAASSPYFKAMFAGKILEHACLLASFTQEGHINKSTLFRINAAWDWGVGGRLAYETDSLSKILNKP